jgi:hypothetical protein
MISKGPVEMRAAAEGDSGVGNGRGGGESPMVQKGGDTGKSGDESGHR